MPCSLGLPPRVSEGKHCPQNAAGKKKKALVYVESNNNRQKLLHRCLLYSICCHGAGSTKIHDSFKDIYLAGIVWFDWTFNVGFLRSFLRGLLGLLRTLTR